MIPTIDATFLRLQLQKLILEKRLDKIFLIQRDGKISVNYIREKGKDRESEFHDLLLLVVKQNLNLIEKTAFKAALYTDAKGIRTKLLQGCKQIEDSIIEQNIVPLLITKAGKIYNRHKQEIDLDPFFAEVQKYLPADLSRVGEEE